MNLLQGFWASIGLNIILTLFIIIRELITYRIMRESEKEINVINKKITEMTQKSKCAKCGNRGWIYSKDGTSRTICDCHY